MACLIDKIIGVFDPYFETVKGHYQRLNVRERWLVNALIGLSIIAICYFLFWSPLYTAANSARSSYISEVNHWMKSKVPLVTGSSRTSNKAPLNKSLLSLVNESASQHRLVLRGAEPKGEDSIKIRLDDVLMSSFIKWVHYLYSRYGIQVSSINLEKQAVPGKVRVTLELSKN